MSGKPNRLANLIAGTIVLLLLLSPSGQLADGMTAQDPVRPEADAHLSLVELYTLVNQPGPLWLAGVNLQGANLYRADLSGANLHAANLQRIILDQADLTNADLGLAALQEARLIQARLDGADLALADLTRARLAGASLVGTKLEGTTLHEAQLSAAKLDGAQLSHVDLRGADLRHASLQHADLTVADLRGVDLRRADLTGANLLNANLQDAYLQDAVLTDITYDAQTIWPAGFDPERPATATPAVGASAEPRHRLRLEINLMPATVLPFNQMAQPDDSARIDRVGDLRLLAEVRTGRRLVVFRSATLAEQLVPRVAGHFDWIAYNLEHSPMVPLADQQDPVAAVQRMRSLADRYGLGLAIGPDHDFVVSHGELLAPYADQFVLQVQRVQGQPELVHSYVLSTSAALRQVNPALEIIVQVRTEGDLDALVALLETLRPHMDGVAILASAETTEFAAALWNRLRQDANEGSLDRQTPSAGQIGTTLSWMQAGRLLASGLLLQMGVLAGILAVVWFFHRSLSSLSPLSRNRRSQPA